MARFPRASGDGPKAQREAAAEGKFPPRERGWSLASLRYGMAILVSPARAGMVRKDVTGAMQMLSFPRASGDGPVIVGEVDDPIEFPPRERGWSRKASLSHCHDFVSPARAGMVPRNGTAPRRSRRFPRASGDGPLVVA